MIPQLSLLQLAALVVVAIGTVTDIKSRKIPNLLTFPAALIAIVIQFIQFGLNGVIAAVAGWLTGVLITASPLIVMTLFGRKKKMGFGDVKLMGALGAFLGAKVVLIVFFYFCLFYGAVGIVRVCAIVPWKKLILLATAPGTSIITAQDLEKIRQVRQSYMPLAPAILAATVVALLLEQQTLRLFGLT